MLRAAWSPDTHQRRAETRTSCTIGATNAVCWHTMKRTTVKLPDDLDLRLRREAQRQDRHISDLTRDAIEAYLGGGRRHLHAAAAGRSGCDDISERIEEILPREVGGSHS